MTDTSEKKPEILIVEDSPTQAELARYQLEGNYRISVAANGVEALERLRVKPVDLILSDVLMPKMDGYRLCRECKGDESLRDIPFVLLTATYLDEKDEEFARSIGADQFVVKPIEQDALLRIIAEVLAQFRPARGPLPSLTAADEIRYLDNYSERVVQKLEQKIEQLEQEVAERQKAEASLHLAGEVLEHCGEGILVTDAANRILSVNRAFVETTGYSAEESLGRDPKFLGSGRQTPSFYRALWDSLARTGRWQGEVQNRRKNGEIFPVWLSIRVVQNAAGEITHYIGISTDLTERKAAMERIQFLAHYDELTGLPKRGLLKDRLEMAVASAQRSNRRVALLFLDLDRFKNINDSLGHLAGDALLQAVADRLKACLRQQDTLARTGGDEFIVMLPNVREDEEAAQVASKLQNTLRAPFRIEGRALYVTVSIGISLYPDDGPDFGTLSRSADAALYQVKETGRDHYRFFTPELNTKVTQHLEMENSLRRALAQEEFELHYQPQWDMVQRRIIGVEALLRWHDPEEGWIAPSRFIPLAERTHLILPLGEWVIRSACRQNRLWQDSGVPPVPVAVNISFLQFSQPAFSQTVARILEETGLQPEWLELELTESIFMETTEATMATVNALKAMGLRLAIDDFGTGYSSLSRLKRLPIDKLKIDQSFVRDVATDPDDATIVRAIIGLANNLRITVLAEGVETQGQCRFLNSERCREAQGYYFSKPLPPEKIEPLLRANA